MENKRIIIGVTGASGVILARHLLAALATTPGTYTHLIVSEAARLTWQLEINRPIEEFLHLANEAHDEKDFGAVIASGSYTTAGMVVIPCSMKSLAGIAHGFADTLLLRAADVCLKENRRVVLVPRETPLGKVHIQNMAQASDIGCTILPPMLTFYNNPQNLDDQINHITGKIMMQFGLPCPNFKPWQGG